MADPVAEGYDAVYRSWRACPAFHELWALGAVLGDTAAGFEHLNFASLEQMQRIATELRFVASGRLLDVACGAGGPGLWVAREHQARLVGVDLSAVGTRLAAERAEGLGIADANFVVSSAARTGLVDGCIDAAMSVDSLQYVPDKSAVFSEIFRVLAPAGRFVFTAFELDAALVAALPVLGDDPVEDYAPVLRAVGFELDTYEETPDWEARLTGAYGAVVAEESSLRPEMGDAAMDALMLEMSLTLAVRPYRRRVYVSAQRPVGS